MFTIYLAAAFVTTVEEGIIFPVKASSVQHMAGKGTEEWLLTYWQKRRIWYFYPTN